MIVNTNTQNCIIQAEYKQYIIITDLAMLFVALLAVIGNAGERNSTT